VAPRPLPRLTTTSRPTLAFVAPWECSRAVANIPKAPRDDVIVLLLESVAKGASLPWHRQKLVLILSSLHHFADELRNAGYRVILHRAPSYADGLVEVAEQTGAWRVVATEPREWDMQEELERAEARLTERQVSLVRRPDRGFLASREEFVQWAQGRKEHRMEWFYRDMRRKWNVLLEPDGSPVGGSWNYDTENRKPWPRGRSVPPAYRVTPDALTQRQMARVASWKGRWGRVDTFGLPVTRQEAKAWLEQFVTERLPEFGPYEDAIVAGEHELLHSSLSSLINVGLLHPLEVVRRAERAYREGTVPIASAEGFIRQILGWREYIRGMYWHLMPTLRTVNALDATLPLPQWYWAPDGEPYGNFPQGSAPCEMQCLADSIRQVRDHGHTHHINRLMVQSNFATLLGVEPAALSRWFWAGFTDAYEWVELPNVMGMSTFADGGRIASKPYVSTGAYIKRMGNHCASCRFNPEQRTGTNACPFTVLYWDFLAKHRDRFAKHPRMAMMIRNLDRIAPEELTAIRAQADAFRQSVPFDVQDAPSAA